KHGAVRKGLSKHDSTLGISVLGAGACPCHTSSIAHKSTLFKWESGKMGESPNFESFKTDWGKRPKNRSVFYARTVSFHSGGRKPTPRCPTLFRAGHGQARARA